jgi:hypothetical protein
MSERGKYFDLAAERAGTLFDGAAAIRTAAILEFSAGREPEGRQLMREALSLRIATTLVFYLQFTDTETRLYWGGAGVESVTPCGRGGAAAACTRGCC